MKRAIGCSTTGTADTEMAAGVASLRSVVLPSAVLQASVKPVSNEKRMRATTVRFIRDSYWETGVPPSSSEYDGA